MSTGSNSIKVIIEVRGGVVQYITANKKMDICIIDYDNMERDEEWIETLNHIVFTSPSCVTAHPADTYHTKSYRELLEQNGY